MSILSNSGDGGAGGAGDVEVRAVEMVVVMMSTGWGCWWWGCGW